MVLGDAIFPPIPSEMVVITGGALSADGRANIFLVLALAAVASWTGDIVVFQLFRRRLSHVLDRWKWGRRVPRGHPRGPREGRQVLHLRGHHRRQVHSGRAAGHLRRRRHCQRFAAGVQPVRGPRRRCCGHAGWWGWAISRARPRSCRSGRVPSSVWARPGGRRRRRHHRDPAPRQPLPRGGARPLG